MSADPEPDIVITFRPLPDEVPVPVRIRALLRTALRRDRLKCISVRGAEERETENDHPGAGSDPY